MDKQTYKIAVVGNRDAILPFRLIGFQTYPVTEPQEAGKLRDYLPDRGYCSGHSRYSSFLRPAADTGSDPYPDP